VTARYLESWVSPSHLHMLAGELSQRKWVQVMPPPVSHSWDETLGGSVCNPSSSPQLKMATHSAVGIPPPLAHARLCFSAEFLQKVMSMQQDEYIPVVTKHFSPLRRGVIEPQRLQAKTAFTEHKTALVHQSSKQYRGEFLIFLNCHLETIHHPLLKLSRGG